MLTDRDPRLKYRLPKLRRKHKDLYWITVNEFDEYGVGQIIVRPLTRREFMYIQQDIEAGCDPADIILATCVVWPEYDWNNTITNKFYDLPYRTFDQLSDIIIQVSGFASNELIAETFMNARKAANSLDAVLGTIICKTFGHISPSDIDDMTLWDIARLFAMAENTLPEPIDLRIFLDEQYAQKIMLKEKRKQARQSKFNVPGAPGTFGRVRPGKDIPPIPPGWQSSVLPNEALEARNTEQ